MREWFVEILHRGAWVQASPRYTVVWRAVDSIRDFPATALLTSQAPFRVSFEDVAEPPAAVLAVAVGS
jgi:hypothetical protein